MRTKAQAGSTTSPGRSSRVRTNRELDLYDTSEENKENDTTLPPLTERGYHDNSSNNVSPGPQTSRRVPVHERLYDPDFRKHRQSHETEVVYNRDFKARLPKNLEHVTSRFMDQEYFEPKPEVEKEIEDFPQFKAYIPKNLEHVKSKILDPGYYEPKGEYVLDTEENPQFKARHPKNMEHVQSRHLNEEYFHKRSSPDPAMYDPHYNRFTARVPKGMDHVESRILDEKYFAPKSYPEREEHYDTEFKAHIPKYLEHIPVESRLLDPKKPKPLPKDEAEVFQTSFRAKPPKSLEHVESRILDPSFYEPKASYVVQEDEEINAEFKSRPPRSLQHVEKRIYDPRYFQKKEQKPTTEDREVQNMHTDFKAKLPRGLEHVKSKAFDQAMAKSPSRMSETSLVELKTKGPVVLIKVKKDPNARPNNATGYMDRLHAEKMTKDKDYYKQWRKEFEDQKEEPNTARNGKTNSKQEPLKAEEVQEEVKKERKPWRPPRRPKREVVNKEFFDSWVVTPTHIYTAPDDMFLTNRRNVSEMWNNLATDIDKAPVNNRRIRSVDRYY